MTTTTTLPSPNQLAQERTDLAVTRTLMAADRTLMAWVRTALSLLSFGFTIYKILEGFQTAGRVLPNPNTPRNVGLFLVGMGTAAVIMGTIEYLQTYFALGRRKPQRRPSFVMAVLMAITGLSLLVGISARVF